MLTPTSLLPVALEAVEIASELVRTSRPAAHMAKGDRDLATDVDFAVERRLRQFLADRTPTIDFLGEEEGATVDESRDLLWTLDPIDGTVNYSADIPLCAVSLALVHDARPILGVIDLPFLNARYWATDRGGAFLNDRRLQVAGARSLGEAIVALGDFAVGPAAERQNRLQVSVADQLATRALRVRMLGSAAIDLAWLAEAKLHASITLCNPPWDMAAGVVIAREAGASVLDIDGSDYSMDSRFVIAAPPLLATEILDTVREADRLVEGRA